jgi:16S rRNA (adenine1518-N6/adenine1519-N6)-dimethyltransferase
MLQDEVARRVAAAAGSKEYGILSVLYALWAEVDVPLRFGPSAFDPPPKVSSAVLRARFLASPRAQVADVERFERLLRAAFARRRRTLENNLRDSYPNLKEHLRLLNIEGSRRAETLSVVEFALLARALEH